jgi:taurine--2-oxoglutarate transaminase
MVQAIQSQVAELGLALPNANFPAKQKLSEQLLDLAPDGYSRVFYTVGGAEAVENALKMARLFTGRQKLISRYRSYHGATMGALSLTGDYRRPPLEPGIPGVIHALDCYCERCPFGRSLRDCNIECASHIGDLLELEGPGTVAAVVLEAIPGANGCLIPPPDYWPRVREACDKHGTLLVADEVLTGFGRTGKWFAFEHFNVVPDLITVGKGLTGGYAPLGAVLVHDRVARFFDDNFLYAGLTNYAHPLGCAAGSEAIQIYQDEDLITHAANLGPELLNGFKKIQSEVGPSAPFVRGLGLFAAMELDLDAAGWARLDQELKDRKVFVHARPRQGTVLVAPPINIETHELKMGIDLIRSSILATLQRS